MSFIHHLELTRNLGVCLGYSWLEIWLEQNKGTVEMESEEGTTFSIIIPKHEVIAAK